MDKKWWIGIGAAIASAAIFSIVILMGVFGGLPTEAVRSFTYAVDRDGLVYEYMTFKSDDATFICLEVTDGDDTLYDEVSSDADRADLLEIEQILTTYNAKDWPNAAEKYVENPPVEAMITYENDDFFWSCDVPADAQEKLEAKLDAMVEQNLPAVDVTAFTAKPAPTASPTPKPANPPATDVQLDSIHYELTKDGLSYEYSIFGPKDPLFALRVYDGDDQVYYEIADGTVQDMADLQAILDQHNAKDWPDVFDGAQTSLDAEVSFSYLNDDEFYWTYGTGHEDAMQLLLDKFEDMEAEYLPPFAGGGQSGAATAAVESDITLMLYDNNGVHTQIAVGGYCEKYAKSKEDVLIRKDFSNGVFGDIAGLVEQAKAAPNSQNQPPLAALKVYYQDGSSNDLMVSEELIHEIDKAMDGGNAWKMADGSDIKLVDGMGLMVSTDGEGWGFLMDTDTTYAATMDYYHGDIDSTDPADSVTWYLDEADVALISAIADSFGIADIEKAKGALQDVNILDEDGDVAGFMVLYKDGSAVQAYFRGAPPSDMEDLMHFMSEFYG